jgi:flagellar biogenesis protein FliO
MMKFIFAAILSEATASPVQIGIAETVVRMAIFLALLALGGYFFVLFHRRGYFGNTLASPLKRVGDEIQIIAMRPIGGKKLLTVVEHRGRRFLLALTNDSVCKISEWDIGPRD